MLILSVLLVHCAKIRRVRFGSVKVRFGWNVPVRLVSGSSIASQKVSASGENTCTKTDVVRISTINME